MNLHLHNATTRVVACTDEEWLWLREFLSFDEATFYGGRRRSRRYTMVTASGTFPGGMTRLVYRAARAGGMPVNVVDQRAAPCAPLEPPDWLRDYQADAVRACIRRTRGLLWHATGCHRAGQEVIRADGTLVRVEDVRVGDELLGPDGEVRTVLRLCRGRQQMAEVVPAKGNPFVVNLDHMLSLQTTSRGGSAPSAQAGLVRNVTVREWLKWPKARKHVHKLYRAQAVAFRATQAELPIAPYFLGVLIGDGCLTTGAAIANSDVEIIDAIRRDAAAAGCAVRERRRSATSVTWGVVTPPGKPNPFVHALRALGLSGKTAQHKFIPPAYKVASINDRLHLLAGLLDTDGYLGAGYFEFSTKSPLLARDVAFVARSVGLGAQVSPKFARWQSGEGWYWRLSITGDVDRVPTKVRRKQAPPRKQKKSVLRTGFSVRLLGEEDYYGFTLDGDELYLLSDFTVTHNSGKTHVAAGLVWSLPCRWLFLAHRGVLVHQAADRFEKLLCEPVGRIAEGRWSTQRITCATFQTLSRRADDPAARRLLGSVGGVIADECHVVGASAIRSVVMDCAAYYRIGLSGTPLDRGDRRSVLAVGALGTVIHRVTTEELTARGLLAESVVRFVPVHQGWRAAGRQRKHATVYRDLVVRSHVRNRAIVDVALAADKPCLVFVQHLKHGKWLVDLLRAGGLEVEFVQGKDDDARRRSRLDALQRGRLDVVVATVVLQEGVDVPGLRSVVNAGAGKSVIAVLQRVGRGMRVAAGKQSFQIWDVADSGDKWTEAHYAARVKALQREGHVVTVGHVGGPTVTLDPPRKRGRGR